MFIIRILLGSDNVKCPTPRAETRLRCGEVALIPLQLQCRVIIINDNNLNNNDNNNNLIAVTLTLIFPKTGYPSDIPLDVIITYDDCIYNDNTNSDEILTLLKEFCKERIDSNDYPRYIILE